MFSSDAVITIIVGLTTYYMLALMYLFNKYVDVEPVDTEGQLLTGLCNQAC